MKVVILELSANKSVPLGGVSFKRASTIALLECAIGIYMYILVNLSRQHLIIVI